MWLNARNTCKQGISLLDSSSNGEQAWAHIDIDLLSDLHVLQMYLNWWEAPLSKMLGAQSLKQ